MLTAFLLALSPLAAQAAYTNPNTILLGERAAGMGGAYTALAADPAATPFYNPATTILQEGSSFSGSVSIFNKYETNIGQGGDFLGAPTRINRGFFRGVPASTGTILNYKTYAVGLSILNPDYDYYSGEVEGDPNTVSSLSLTDQSLWVGGTFSTRFSEVDSIGFSLYYTARTLVRSVDDHISTGGGTGAIINVEDKNLTSNNLVAIVGYHHQFKDHWAAGLSYRLPSLQIAGEGTYYHATTQTTPFSETVTNQTGIRAITKIPQRIGIGVAHEDRLKSTQSLDIQVFLPVSYHDFPDYDLGSDDVRYRLSINAAAGAEYFLKDWVSLRGGVFTNLASTEDIQASSTFRQPDHLNLYGFSANVNFRTHEQTSFTFGGYYTGGTGISSQFEANSVRVLQKSQQIFTMLVGTGFHF